jgi:iron-sulfur cluster repair protein YtfE (RIC family)
MLENMQKKVEAEGKKEEELFEKFMCYCKGGRAQLEASLAPADAKIEELTSSVEEAEGQKAQLDEDRPRP